MGGCTDEPAIGADANRSLSPQSKSPSTNESSTGGRTLRPERDTPPRPLLLIARNRQRYERWTRWTNDQSVDHSSGLQWREPAQMKPASWFIMNTLSTER